MPKLYQTNESVLTFTTETGTDTLQAAINLAQTTGKPLFIAAGTYNVADLLISASVRIYGSRGRTNLKLPTGSSSRKIFNIAPTSGRLADVTLEGLGLYGLDPNYADGPAVTWTTPATQATYQGLIHVRTTDHLTIRDCYIANSHFGGIFVNDCSGFIQNNDISGCQTGIFVDHGSGLVIESNYIRDSKDNGIRVEHLIPGSTLPGHEGAIIRANKIYTVKHSTGGSGQFGNGIICSYADGLAVSDNIIWGVDYSGVRFNACSSSHVSNNTIMAARETALFIESLGEVRLADVDYPIEGYKGVTATGNVIVDAGSAIAVVNPEIGARRVTVTGNSISRLKTNTYPEWSSIGRDPAKQYQLTTNAIGIVAAGSDIVIQGNILEGKIDTATDNPRMGIFLYSTGDWNIKTSARRTNTSVASLVVNNVIKTCPVGIGYNDWDSRGYAEISGNAIIGASAGKNVILVDQSGNEIPGTPPADLANVTVASSQRYSFDRNKAIPLTSP